MIKTLLRKVFGTRNERLLKQMGGIVERINALESQCQALSDDELRAKTDAFRKRFADGETLEAILPEAFAVVRETSVRTLGMRHFDVQLIGGITLHTGKIAEMRTGEGKTLTSTLAAYLNALTGDGVHIVTVNDYLASRDAEWMRPIYEFLGLSVGVILSEQLPDVKRAAYKADITFGTNNEFGFDYLRDNMAFSLEDRAQGKLAYAIVDEVDSILIDEARTPLIISGPSDESSDLYAKIDAFVPKLERQAPEPEKEKTSLLDREREEGAGDYVADEKAKQAFLTEAGHQRVEALFIEAGLLQHGESLYDAANITLMHHLNAALRAHALYQKDVDYIVKDDQVIIVDEHTGRLMAGRRWSDGLHQAVEAKERVNVQAENQTLASITFQNYFRLYGKLSGMTGTADTEAFEFQQIYGLEVVIIPTNVLMLRKELGDQIYLTLKEKFQAVIDDIKERLGNNQPVLVGTASIETSEYLSSLLKKANIEHQVLNAKFHEKEAKIVAQAGAPGEVTIATNMAGRGTDIVLGGNFEAEIAALDNPSEETIAKHKAAWDERHKQVVDAGGLHIVGTERHESRRIDNQLRGRSGRQGDPGSSRFYLSLEDDLMRIFASDRVANIMKKLGMRDGESIEHPLVTRAIENAQRKVEGRNFDTRKQLLEYDDVANDQRKVIYEQRTELMVAEDIGDTVSTIREDVINAVTDEYIPPQSFEEQWDVSGLEQTLTHDFQLSLDVQGWLKKEESLHEETLRERIAEQAKTAAQEKETQVSSEVMRQLEKSVMLQSLDTHWKEHLAAMDHLRQGIHLRGYAQKNPAQEFKRESFEMFSSLLDNIKRDVISTISLIQVQAESDVQAAEEQRREFATSPQNMQFLHANTDVMATEAQEMVEEEEPVAATPFTRETPKVGRNDPCPCNSGKKYKQCHGQIR